MTALPAPEQTRSIQELANNALDKSFSGVVTPILEQIQLLFVPPRSRMQRALSALDEEVKRLEDDEKRITADNAQLEQVLNVYNDNLNASAAIIDTNAPAIQETGQVVAIPAMTARVFMSLSGALLDAGQDPVSTAAMNFFVEQLASRDIRWNVPTALDFASNYVDTPVWTDRLDRWGDGYADLARNSVLQGIQQGWGPRRTASYMRQTAENIPVHAAENLTRTLQLTAYRDASAAMELQNAHAIEKKLRIAKLDDRTCLTCISLHGTEMQAGERVDDHYRGRCTEFYVVPGGPQFPDMMQADSQPGERNFVPFQTGEEWFNSLSPERQQRQASFQQTPAKWRAFQDGVPLSDFVGDYEDDLFGHQFVENSLKGVLGDDAAQYYSFQPKPPDVGPSFSDMSQEEQDALFNQFNDAIFDDLAAEQAQAASDYTAGGFHEINESLRDFDTDSSTQEQVDLINGAIDGTPGLPGDTTLYRGISGQEYVDAYLNGDLSIGDIVTDEAFMSTSLDPNIAEGFFSRDNQGVIYQILAPEGTSGIYVAPISNLEEEAEWLLPSGTSLQIVDIDTSNPDAIQVIMEIVN